MGYFTQFYLGKPDGIEQTIMSQMADFAEWMRNAEIEHPGDFSLELINIAEKLSKEGVQALYVQTEQEARLIDFAVDTMQIYFECEGKEPFVDITESLMRSKYYAKSLDEVVPHCSDIGSNYYQLLFSGRSLVRKAEHQYKTSDGVYYISWLLPDEVIEFRQDLESYSSNFCGDSSEEHGVFFLLRALKHAEKEKTSLVVEIA